jgi:hypothetical protein
MLIMAKALMNETAEGIPVEARKLMLDRLKPMFGYASELHSGALDPN